MLGQESEVCPSVWWSGGVTSAAVSSKRIFLADCTADLICTNTHGHSMFSCNDNVQDIHPETCICALFFEAHTSMCVSKFLAEVPRNTVFVRVCMCLCVHMRWLQGFGEGLDLNAWPSFPKVKMNFESCGSVCCYWSAVLWRIQLKVSSQSRKPNCLYIDAILFKLQPNRHFTSCHTIMCLLSHTETKW